MSADDANDNVSRPSSKLPRPPPSGEVQLASVDKAVQTRQGRQPCPEIGLQMRTDRPLGIGPSCFAVSHVAAVTAGPP